MSGAPERIVRPGSRGRPTGDSTALGPALREWRALAARQGLCDVRDKLEQAYVAKWGRRPHRVQLDWMELVGLWLVYMKSTRGPSFTVHRTVPQMAVDALKLEDMGTVKKNRRRYRNQLDASLRYLAELGWVDGRGLPRDDTGLRHTGWLIVLGSACPRSSTGRARGF